MANFLVIVCVCHFDSLLWLAKNSLSCASVEYSSVRGELPKPESVFFSSSFIFEKERLQVRKTELGSAEPLQAQHFQRGMPKDATDPQRDGKGKLQGWELPKVDSVPGYSAEDQLSLCT